MTKGAPNQRGNPGSWQLLAGSCQFSVASNSARPAAENGVITGITSHWGPHHGPQSSMLMGLAGAGVEGKPSSHYTMVEDTCVSCHLGEGADHTFDPSIEWDEFGLDVFDDFGLFVSDCVPVSNDEQSTVQPSVPDGWSSEMQVWPFKSEPSHSSLPSARSLPQR